ncbi:hypothetical protein FQA39_LY03611 [Lamprigera yunnana]|nr:hypothetical protein FQA39_LY03611 [Lamprigera yunnana]
MNGTNELMEYERKKKDSLKRCKSVKKQWVENMMKEMVETAEILGNTYKLLNYKASTQIGKKVWEVYFETLAEAEKPKKGALKFIDPEHLTINNSVNYEPPITFRNIALENTNLDHTAKLEINKSYKFIKETNKYFEGAVDAERALHTSGFK